MKDREATPFDHRPDAELGGALLAALDAGDSTAFVAGVVGRFDAARIPARAWDVLGRWAGRGIAAAVVAALALVLIGRAAAEPVSLDEALVASSDPATSVTTALLVGDRPPDPGAVFAAVVGAER
jgi:hypothetical protein